MHEKRLISEAREAKPELFLDTEMQVYNFDRSARRLIQTGLPPKEMDQIYSEEVAPILYSNLNVTAGEWAGFDQNWLTERISKKVRFVNLLKKSRTFLRRYIKWITRDTLEDWKKILKMIEPIGVG